MESRKCRPRGVIGSLWGGIGWPLLMVEVYCREYRPTNLGKSFLKVDARGWECFASNTSMIVWLKEGERDAHYSIFYFLWFYRALQTPIHFKNVWAGAVF
jgi:hypothetical protein